MKAGIVVAEPPRTRVRTLIGVAPARGSSDNRSRTHSQGPPLDRFSRLLPLAALATLAGCGNGNDAPLMGTLERDRVELVAEAQEPILTLSVTEGQAVKAGQVLAVLDRSTIDARLAQARAAVAQARQRLAELVNGPRVEEVLEARARLEGAESRVVTASRELERVSRLVEQKLLAPTELDRQRASADTARSDRKQAEARLQVLLAGTRIEQLDQARSALAAAEAQQKQLEVSAARMTITAPRDGRIDALPYELGERPPPGAPVVVMLADGAPYARVYVPEPIRARVVPGTSATVRVDGSARAWRGRVRYVSAEAAFTPYYTLTQKDRSRLSFLAEVTLTEAGAQALPSGVPVEVSLELAPPQ